MKKLCPESFGFTLVEILVAIVISGLIIVGLMRFYSTSQLSYSLQEQVSEMRMNSHYTLNHLTDVLMEAGAALPDTGLIPIVQQKSAKYDSVQLYINPKGGMQGFGAAVSGTKIPVKRGLDFQRAKMILRRPTPLLSYDIWPMDSVKITASDTVADTLFFPSSKSIANGDTLFSCNTARYYLKGANLCYDVDTNVLAQNIEKLDIRMLDTTDAATTDWGRMKYAKIAVVARTALPDRHRPGDGYRRDTLSNEFRLRNKM
jgi:prepilin-type N-terminal cleavage/methylation domain-containing protein